MTRHAISLRCFDRNVAAINAVGGEAARARAQECARDAGGDRIRAWARGAARGTVAAENGPVSASDALQLPLLRFRQGNEDGYFEKPITIVGPIVEIDEHSVTIDRIVTFNSTDSMPMDFYTVDPRAIVKSGSIVVACPPSDVAKLGLSRHYIRLGRCDSGAAYLLKIVVATAGDVVVANDEKRRDETQEELSAAYALSGLTQAAPHEIGAPSAVQVRLSNPDRL